MSRVHDALRRAEQSGELTPPAPRSNGDARAAAPSPNFDAGPNLGGLLEQVQEVPFRTATDSLLAPKGDENGGDRATEHSLHRGEP